MNERIRQLALDAGIGFTLWDDSGRAMIDNYTPEERLAKFAELIVAECAQIADTTSVSGPPRGCTYGNVIHEHFGVAE
jgi:hypothetical protein